ncbi:acyltransferase family protein [Rhodococcus ruber]|uniref:acyltransferase family protein n=1 Tax=Rhodococcus ruber TaxID=1830 RepID=UPI0009D9A9A1|nr:acyltransferase family protein [Rhodococcus ruber]
MNPESPTPRPPSRPAGAPAGRGHRTALQEATTVRRLGASVRHEASSAAGYRHDLDGLRGLAIGLVVVYHLWFGRVSGGVDVFLVLSGFFFTGLLLRRTDDSGGPPVAQTVARTARRLLPALVVVLAAVAVATAIGRPFTQWSDTVEELLASLLYVQNWHLARTAADYQAADASVSAMQHLWSMSVQGQFYVLALTVVAAVAWMCRRRGRPHATRPVLTVVLTAGFVGSFLYATIVSRTEQAWAYYDTGARLWELLAGSLLYLALGRVSLPRRRRSLLAAAGLALVLTCGVFLDGANVFPGPAALVPVGATAALVLAGAHTTRGPGASRILASRPLLALGRIAYALYLWHWPVLIFYLSWRDRPAVGPLGGLVVLGVSLVLAWLTHTWIESPLRKSPRPAVEGGARPLASRAATALVLTAGLTVVTCAAAWQWYVTHNPETATRVGDLDPARYPGAASLTDGAFTPDAPMRPTLLEAPNDLPPSTYDGCISDLSTRDVIVCTYGDPAAERTVALAGSSHAEHWLTALDEIGQSRGVRLVTYLKMGCPLTLADEPMLGDQPYPDCRDWSRDVLDRLREEPPDWVFSTATRPRPDGPGDYTPGDYVAVWERLADYGLPFLGIRDTPWLHHDGVPYSAVDCLAEGGDATSCGMPRDAVLSAENPTFDAAAGLPTVRALDLSDAVCDTAICRVAEGNILVYHDSHHLAATYVRSLTPELDRQIGIATGWW